jgi:hypothetical protein
MEDRRLYPGVVLEVAELVGRERQKLVSERQMGRQLGANSKSSQPLNLLEEDEGYAPQGTQSHRLVPHVWGDDWDLERFSWPFVPSVSFHPRLRDFAVLEF